MKQGWEIKKIKDICDKASSNIAQNKITELDGDYPVYGASGFVQNVDFYHRDTEYIGIVKDGSGVGRVNTYPAYSSLLGTLQYIIPKEGYALNYVAYALKSLNLAEYASGAAIPHIYFKDYGEETIPVPSREEQERIVAELDCLSGIIAKKKEQLKALDALAESIFYTMFGDPITNEKGWETSQFDNACELITDFVAAGSFADIKHNVKYIDRPDFAQLIRTTDIKNQFTKSDYVYVSESAFNYLWRVKLDKESIILPNVGVNCGEVYYITPTMLPYKNNVLGPNAILVRSNKENNRYLSFLFKTSYFQYQLRTIVNAVGQPKFNKTELKQLSVILPPLTLQQEFADKIEAIEKQKELIKKSIAEVETLFNSRMDYYFN